MPDGKLAPGCGMAIVQGCTCTSPYNMNGLGWFGDGEMNGWDVAMDCPMHGLGDR